MFRKAIYIIIILFTGYIASVSALYYFQNDMIFWPECIDEAYCFQFEEPFEEFYLNSSNGHDINVLHFKTVKPRKGVVLYLHGNSKHLGYWAKYSTDFLERGYDFFAIDYQGYGKSEGSPSEESMYNDALTAYNYLCKEVASEHIVIYGRSLGTAAASHLAQSQHARLLVLETPFYNMQDVFESKSKYLLYPIRLEHHFPNDKHLVEVDIPVHIIHGTKDEVIEYESALKLTEFLKEGDSFATVEGGKHRNLNQFEEYQNFLDRILIRG